MPTSTSNDLRILEGTQRRRQQNRESQQRTRSSRRLAQHLASIQTSSRELHSLEHSCGAMDVECENCGALHFLDEKMQDGSFRNCCHKGKVRLIRPEYPMTLRALLEASNDPRFRKFQQQIRSYNSAFAFASMGAQIEELAGNGPYCFRVHGQVYHCTSHLHPPAGEPRKFCQLYVIDGGEALKERLALPPNRECDAGVMAHIQALLEEINVYARCFRFMADVEREATTNARLLSRPTPQVNMIFRRDRRSDHRRNNFPTVDEVAFIFSGNEGEPPFERDFQVYPKGTDHQLVPIHILSPHLDPMVYPLLFPHGEPGWQPNMTAEGYHNRQRSSITMLQFKIYLLAVRRGVFNAIHHAGKLAQQYIVDSYLQVL